MMASVALAPFIGTHDHYRAEGKWRSGSQSLLSFRFPGSWDWRRTAPEMRWEMQIKEALERYTIQLEADGRSPLTIDQVGRHVRLLVAWLASSGHSGKVELLTHEDIARFLASDAVTKRADGAPRRPTSGNAIRSSVRTFSKYVHDAGYVASNPARLVRRARCGAPKPRGLSDVDVAKLRAVLETAFTRAERRDRALFLTLLDAGIRIGSAVHLEVGDTDLDAGELHLRRMKNADEDTVFLPARTVAMLRAYVGGRVSGPLFPASHGGRMTTRSAHARLEVWAERAGITRRVSAHGLRHTFAMALYRRTGDVMLVCRALCHRSVASTATYARADNARVRAAVG